MPYTAIPQLITTTVVEKSTSKNHRFMAVLLSLCSTSLQDLLDLDVVGAEATVELEVVSVVQEGTPERKQKLL